MRTLALTKRITAFGEGNHNFLHAKFLDVDSFSAEGMLQIVHGEAKSEHRDISLAERINSFLESFENTRLGDSSDSFSGSNSEDEKGCV